MWSCNQSSSFRSEIYTFCRLHSNPRAQLGIFRTLKLCFQSPMYDTRLLASYMMWSQSPIYDTRLLYMALGQKTEHPFSFLRRPEKLCQTMKPNLVPGRSLAILHQLLYLVCTTYFRRVSNTFGMYQTVLDPQGANIAPMFLRLDDLLIFGPLWIILAHSRAILGHLGSYLGHFGPFWAIFGPFVVATVAKR